MGEKRTGTSILYILLLSWLLTSYPAPTSARSFLIFPALSRPPLSKNCRLPWALFRFRNCGRGPDIHLRLNGKSHRRILAFGLTTSSVAVDWLLCARLSGSVALGRSLWAPCLRGEVPACRPSGGDVDE